MRLKRARVTNYRSIVDTGWFDVERAKTIFVGPNEAGKSAILQALQQINPPQNAPKFDALRDYPRSKYNDITTGRVDPKSVKVVEVEFELDDEDRAALPETMRGVTYVFGRRLDNSAWHSLKNAPVTPTYGSISKDLTRLCAHIDPRAKTTAPEGPAPSEDLAAVTSGWSSTTTIDGDQAKSLQAWLDKILPLVDESSEAEEERFDKLVKITNAHFDRVATLGMV